MTDQPDLTHEPTVTRDDAQSRYEVHVGDVLAGFTEFRTDSRGRVAFPHTEVDPAFRGKGLAGALIGQAMTDSAARGDTVVPLCPAVAKYVRANEIDGLTLAWPDNA